MTNQIDPLDVVYRLGGEFVRVAGGQQVFEFPNMDAAKQAMEQVVGAEPYNWNPAAGQLSPSNPRLGIYRRPQIVLPR